MQMMLVYCHADHVYTINNIGLVIEISMFIFLFVVCYAGILISGKMHYLILPLRNNHNKK